jgi:hypothetical protein
MIVTLFIVDFLLSYSQAGMHIYSRASAKGKRVQVHIIFFVITIQSVRSNMVFFPMVEVGVNWLSVFFCAV